MEYKIAHPTNVERQNFKLLEVKQGSVVYFNTEKDFDEAYIRIVDIYFQESSHLCISICSMDGKAVKKIYVECYKNTQHAKIILTNIERGIYLVKVQYADGSYTDMLEIA